MRKVWAILFVIVMTVFLLQLMQSFSPKTITPLKQEIPEGFPRPHYTFKDNQLTKEGFELGRKLFYDGRLSKDRNFPCASCHQQFAAFSTYQHDLSHGYNNSFTTRNAPALFNLAWQKEFHLDGGINNIEVQPLAPITAPNEMAEDITNVVNKLKQDPAYRKMFKAAFGDEKITSQKILKALTQFICSIVSADSKYDRVKKGKASFIPFEQRGYDVFKAKCATCHPEPLFTDFSYRNIGLPVDTFLNDYGRMRITNDKADSLKFKVPSLRNVDLTSPYMHDGRFWFLSQVLDHYRKGVQKSATLDSSLTDGIPLTNLEVTYLVSFLRTLTDSSLIKNPRFAAPPQ